MTESDWISCTDPQPMLESLRGKVSDRKLRLFACGCCRQISVNRLRWVYQDAGVNDDDWDTILTTAESFADGAAASEDFLAACALAERVDRAEAWQSEPASATATAVAAAVSLRPTQAWARKLDAPMAPEAVAFEAVLQAASEAAFAAEEAAQVAATKTSHQANLVRCIFGNPFRSVSIHSSRLTSNVVAVAQGIYTDRAFDRLPILADALEDAGCNQPDILNHCRQPGPHARGCWPLDLLLGKE